MQPYTTKQAITYSIKELSYCSGIAQDVISNLMIMAHFKEQSLEPYNLDILNRVISCKPKSLHSRHVICELARYREELLSW